MAGRTGSASLRTRTRLYACALLAYGIGVGYLATLVLDPHWGFVLVVSTLLLGVATSLYFLELYEAQLTRAVAQEGRLEGATRSTRLMAERLRQPLTVLLGHGELLRARTTGPLDPSVEEIITTAIEIEMHLRQLEAAREFAQQVLEQPDPLTFAAGTAEEPGRGARDT